MIKTFDNLEDMYAEIEAASKAADARVQPWQAQAKVGHKFMTVSPEAGLVIFGEVLDPVEEDRKAGADAEEIAYIKETYAQESRKHYRFCKCYSVACIEGELGDTHVSTFLAFLTPEEFEQCKEADWVPKRALLIKAYNRYNEV